MRKVIAIAFKDVFSTFRNVVALAMMLAAPLVLASLLGLAFEDNDTGYSVGVTKVAFVNLDEGYESAGEHLSVGESLHNVLLSPELTDLLAVSIAADEAAARSAVDTGKAVVAVIVPSGFTAALMNPTSAEVSSAILYQNPTQTLGPAIVGGIVQQVIDAFNGSRAVAAAIIRLAGAPGGPTTQPEAGSPVINADLEKKIAEAAAAYINEAQKGADSGLASRGPQFSGPQAKDPGVAGVVLAGMMVFFMFFGGANVARTIIDEDAHGTLPRLFTTPTPRSIILGGKMASVLLTVLAQSIILLLSGWLLFRVDWGSPVPVALLTLDTALVSAGLAVFLISLVKSPAQASAITSGVFVTLALLGGNFVGGVPPSGFFSTVRRFTPNGWLLEGWDKVLRGAGVSDIALQLVVALAFAVTAFIAGSLVFRRRYA